MQSYTLKAPERKRLGLFIYPLESEHCTPANAQHLMIKTNLDRDQLAMMTLPKRPASHIIGNLAESLVERAITARGWVYRKLDKDKDYGIDGEVEVFSESGQATGIIFKVQVKGSRKTLRKLTLKRSTESYLSVSPLPVFFFVVEVDSGAIRFLLAERDRASQGPISLADADELNDSGFGLLEEIAREHCGACLMMSDYTLHNASAQLIRCLDLLLNFGGDIEAMVKWLRFFAPDEVLTLSYGYAVHLKREIKRDDGLLGRIREWVIEFFPECQEDIDQSMAAFHRGEVVGRRLEVAHV